jgi:hypothetical protein
MIDSKAIRRGLGGWLKALAGKISLPVTIFLIRITLG